jgi:MFS family permease
VVIIWAVVTAATALGAFTVSTSIWLLAASLAVVGLCLGTSITTAFAAGGAVIPQDVHATGFGFLTSASLIGVALGPVLSGLVAAYSIRAVFLTAVVVLLTLAIVVRRVMVERNPPVEPAPVVEES